VHPTASTIYVMRKFSQLFTSLAAVIFIHCLGFKHLFETCTIIFWSSTITQIKLSGGKHFGWVYLLSSKKYERDNECEQNQYDSLNQTANFISRSFKGSNTSTDNQ
jgi:hypothetical protein